MASIAGRLGLLGLLGVFGVAAGTCTATSSRAAEADARVAPPVDAAPPVAAELPRRVLFGDTHLHTSYSFDAFLNGNRSADPDTAYRWAKGLPVIHPYHRARVRIHTPLDFLVVADHAEYLGVIRKLYFDVREGPGAEFANRVREAVDAGKGQELFKGVLPSKSSVEPGDTKNPISAEGSPHALPVDPAAQQLHVDAWAETTTAADRHNAPGHFTALVGWEWSSLPSGANLHRVVVTSASGETARRFLPYGSDKSAYPEDLWKFLDQTTQETGAEFVAIPHNSNISKGYMFGGVTLDESPYTTESAAVRARWEPIVEVTQFKGTSETHPALSPRDPFADFEIYTGYIQQNKQDYVAQPGDYVRTALMRGLEIEEKVGVNPYKFGMIGSTDSHTGLASYEEDNFWGKLAFDSTPETKARFSGGRGITGWNMGAGGLAAVWAEDNTREAIFAAFRRREVYATTGSRMRVRFFGGYRYESSDAEAADIAGVGYAKGVPMGGDLARRPEPKTGLGVLFGGAQPDVPTFLVHASKDPKGGNLDRVQIVKGWIGRDGHAREKVYDVVWAGSRKPGENGELPPIGNTVDLDRGTFTNTIGARELAAVWRDPDFNPQRRAFYYVRVLEIPTPRHSLLDGIALQIDPPDEQPPTLQERAYTSPIWYTP
ncbi:MAG: DUF3604 domain-containing protein [Deltaproteobacteria bacterium]|nr:DUF3604 domain-containing protein [Deltaproteobacteria bacterium]